MWLCDTVEATTFCRIRFLNGTSHSHPMSLYSLHQNSSLFFSLFANIFSLRHDIWYTVYPLTGCEKTCRPTCSLTLVQWTKLINVTEYSNKHSTCDHMVTFFFLVQGSGHPGQLTRTLTNSLPSSVKSRPSMLKLRDSQEITFLKPDPKN